MQKIKKDDEIVVIAGRDKDKRGVVTRVLSDDRLYVSGVNLVKRHTRANPQMGKPGGIIEKEAPIQISNVAIFNTSTNKPDKVSFKILEDGKKVRTFKSSGEQIDN